MTTLIKSGHRFLRCTGGIFIIFAVLFCYTFIFPRCCSIETYSICFTSPFCVSIMLETSQIMQLLYFSCISIGNMLCSSSLCMPAWLMLLMIVSCSIASFRDKSINKWQRMTQVTTGAAAIKGKLHAFNQVRFCNWTGDSTMW